MKTAGDFTLNTLFGIGATLAVLAGGLAFAWLPITLMAPSGAFSAGVNLGMLLGAGVAAGSGIGLLVLAIRRSRRRDAQGPTSDAGPLEPERFEIPRHDWPFGSAVSDAPAPAAAGHATPGQTPARPPAVRPEELLGAAGMSELRIQVASLCRMLGQDEAGGILRAELMDSGIVLNAYWAAGLAQIASRVVAGRDLAEEFAADGLPVSAALLTQVREDLRSIAESLGWLAKRRMRGTLDLGALQAELQSKLRLTANLSPVERLLFLSTLLLSSVSDLASALVDRCNRLPQTVDERATSLGLDAQDGVLDGRRVDRPWPTRAGSDPFAGTDGSEDLLPAPHWKLN